MKTQRTNPKPDTSGVHLWLVLWKAFRSVEMHAHRHIAALGLCLSDFGVLEVLLHKGRLTVKELGAKVMLTSGSMTAALDRLERRGLIEREEGADDRRVRMVWLTQAGSALISEAFADHMQRMEFAAADVGIKDRAVLIGLLKQLGLGAERRLAMDEGARRLEDKSVSVKNGGKGRKRE